MGSLYKHTYGNQKKLIIYTGFHIQHKLLYVNDINSVASESLIRSMANNIM